MATRNLTVRIQMRQDTAANWESINPILAVGEIGYDTTYKLTKIGDGTTVWTGLAAFAVGDIPSVSFQNDSWGMIAKLASEGTADIYYAVGDKKTIILTSGERITLVILGFNHDDLTSGGKAPITIGMENLLATKYTMNPTYTNAGGWHSSVMRTDTMATLFSQLPADLQAVIKQVNKKASEGSGSTTILTSSDKLWLLSNVEIDNTTTAVYANEGVQYDYWKTIKDSTVNANKIKYLANGVGDAASWFLRSPYTSTADLGMFRAVYHTGTINQVGSIPAQGVSFGFCV